jgi:enoyl-CoA hydratase/carnithine racemase
MVAQTVEVKHITDNVASLRVATDESPYLGGWFVPGLRDAVGRLQADETIRAVVVEGGEHYFSAGASRTALLTTEPKDTFPTYVAELPRLLLSLPTPTVAAMAGHAIGGGLVLGLWCDVAVLAEESMYGANFMALGFTPGMGSTAILAEALGELLARELLFTGRLMTGRELKMAGSPLAHAIVPRTEVRRRAIAIAQEMAEVPREALTLLKQALAARRRAVLEQALKEEQAMHAVLFAREETRQQIAARYAVSDAARGRENEA